MLRCVGKGLTNAEIANQLFVGEASSSPMSRTSSPGSALEMSSGVRLRLGGWLDVGRILRCVTVRRDSGGDEPPGQLGGAGPGVRCRSQCERSVSKRDRVTQVTSGT